MSQERFTPKFELGTTVYVVETSTREIYEGVVTIARLEKMPYRNEYGYIRFESKESYAHPSFKENYSIECWIDGKKRIIDKYEHEVYSTAAEAVDYLSSIILRKFKAKE